MKYLNKLAAVLCTCALAFGAFTANSDISKAEGTGSLQGDGKKMVMFVMTASNVYGANQIRGAKEEAVRLGYDLTVFQHNFSQPEQDQQVQQYIASGAQPEVVIFWPWVADAAINAVRQLARIAPVIQLTQEPNEQSWPYVKAYSGANQILIGETA